MKLDDEQFAQDDSATDPLTGCAKSDFGLVYQAFDGHNAPFRN